MHRRLPLPDSTSWVLTRAHDPFCPADLVDFVGATRRKHTLARRDPDKLARRLSGAALRLMSSRRVPGRIRPGDNARVMKTLVARLERLLADYPTDLADRFDPDIGHIGPLRRLMGVPLATSDADWPEQEDAARRVRSAVTGDDLPSRARLVLEAAKHQHAVDSARKRQGKRADVDRHRFVLAVLVVYVAATGRASGVSKPPDGRDRGGPAARFLAAVCGRLLERLTDEERAADPRLETDLKAATAEARAGIWIEEALRWRRHLKATRYAVKTSQR